MDSVVDITNAALIWIFLSPYHIALSGICSGFLSALVTVGACRFGRALRLCCCNKELNAEKINGDIELGSTGDTVANSASRKDNGGNSNDDRPAEIDAAHNPLRENHGTDSNKPLLSSKPTSTTPVKSTSPDKPPPKASRTAPPGPPSPDMPPPKTSRTAPPGPPISRRTTISLPKKLAGSVPAPPKTITVTPPSPASSLPPTKSEQSIGGTGSQAKSSPEDVNKRNADYFASKKKEQEQMRAAKLAAMSDEQREKFLLEETEAKEHDAAKSKHFLKTTAAFKKGSNKKLMTGKRGRGGGRGRGRGGGGSARQNPEPSEPEPSEPEPSEPETPQEETVVQEFVEEVWTALDDGNGSTYYVNEATGETSWGEYDETKWDKLETEDGSPYWYNRITKRTTWTDPREEGLY